LAHFFFRGPLPPDSLLFVGRQQELSQVHELCRGALRSYVILLGAAQTGKTSLLYRLRKHSNPPLPSVMLNLQMIPAATPPALFRYMATEIVKQLGCVERLPAAEETVSGPEFERLLNDLPETVGKATILIDEVGALPQRTAVTMANVLRAIFNDRLLSGFEALERFVFVLAGGSELLHLTMTAVSPFSNIATRIYLEDLTCSEVRQLMAYGFAGTPVKAGAILELADAIYEQTHGHPYLTQRMAALVAQYAQERRSELKGTLVQRASQEMLSSDENIQHLSRDLKDPVLQDAAFRILQNPAPFKHLSSRQEQLHLLGVIRRQDDMAVLRNALYAQMVGQLAEESGIAHEKATRESNAPAVRVKLLTPIIPTAFCHNLSEEAFPLVQLRIDNSAWGSLPAQIYAKASIEGYSDEAVSSVLVPAGECEEIALLPTLQQGPVMKLTEIRPATLRVTVRQVGAANELMLLDQTYAVKLHAHDTALLAVLKPDGSVMDLTDHLCAFVTPHDPEIENLLRKAVEHHPKHRIVGYQGTNNADEGRSIVREQVRALYNALRKDAGMVYINSPLNFGKQEGQITQRVRLPAASLHESQSRANCIDGAVLYASVLEAAGLEPQIVIVPGHAFVGWRVWSGVPKYDFLETTLTGSDEFEAALKLGNQEYEQARQKGDFGRGLFDAKGFARLIDVAACRTRQIYPLA